MLFCSVHTFARWGLSLGELFRIAGGHALVHGLDRCQVFLQIAGGVEEGFHARLLLRIVDIRDEDGNLGSQ